MSKTKRYIEQEMEKGNDVLHLNFHYSDDEYQYALFKQTQEEEWCYYSGMPSPKAYETESTEDE
jgi:hypothetical protein